MSGILQGEVALVTGASRGIGAAIADLLAANGAKVVGTATSDAGAQAIGERLAAKGGIGRNLNVTDGAAVEALIESIGKEVGPVSILVNNAGITRDQLLMRMKDEDWQAILDTNLSSVYRTSKAVMRGMMKARKGRIINIASVVGITGNPGQANYAAAKAGIIAFSKSLAREIGSRGITVNVVAPCAKTRPGGFGPIPASPALHAWLSVDEVAPVVTWLVHEDCTVTGECFSVGGGYVGRVTVAVNDGWRSRSLTPERVRDAWTTVMADGPWTPLPAGRGDLDRMILGVRP